jgi:hypothetical protein
VQEDYDGAGVMILVVGFPRSGTNFLHRLLAHYLDGRKSPAWDGTTVHGSVAKIHWEHQIDDYLGAEVPKLVHIVRDPRDTAVSGYFYYLQHFGHKYDHNISNYSLMEFLKGPFSRGFDNRDGWPCGWLEHVDRWVSKAGMTCTSYERLMRDRKQELMWILFWLGLKSSHDAIAYAVDKSYEYGQKRVPYTHKIGWEKQPKTAIPTVGEWKKHFGRREREFMIDYCGDLMEKLGYG